MQHFEGFFVLISIEESSKHPGDLVGFAPNPLHPDWGGPGQDGGGTYKWLLAILEKPKGFAMSPYVQVIRDQHPDFATGTKVPVLFTKLLHGGNARSGFDTSRVRAVFFRPLYATDLRVAYTGFVKGPVKGGRMLVVRSQARAVGDEAPNGDFPITPGYSGAFVAQPGEALHGDFAYIQANDLIEQQACRIAGLDSLEAFDFFQRRLRQARGV